MDHDKLLKHSREQRKHLREFNKATKSINDYRFYIKYQDAKREVNRLRYSLEGVAIFRFSQGILVGIVLTLAFVWWLS